MARYHITHRGEPGKCRALIQCPLGSVEHYDSKREAQDAYELSMRAGTLSAPVSKASGSDEVSESEKRELMTLIPKRVLQHKATKASVVALALFAISACNNSTDQAVTPYDYKAEEAKVQAQLDQAAADAHEEVKEPDELDRAVEKAKRGYEKAKEDAEWKSKLSSIIKEYEEYLDSYEEPEASPQGYSKYDRAAFKHWTDLDNNNCDTRQDILLRDMKDVTLASDGCTVLSGTLDDPYTGGPIHYVKGNNSVDIDHVAPLSWAWERGAYKWSDAKREQFANDPANLLAVQSSANRSKGASSPEGWMPINRAKACDYGTQFLTIAKKYDLTASSSDLSSVKQACQ